jgi:hypothetical protein
MSENFKHNIFEIARYNLNMRLRPNQIYDFRGAFIDMAVRSNKVTDDEISLLANRSYQNGVWGKSLNHYPYIQYRVDGSNVEVCGMGQGIKVIEKLINKKILESYTFQDRHIPLYIDQSQKQSLVIFENVPVEYFLFHYIPYDETDDHVYHAKSTMIDKISVLEKTISNGIKHALKAFDVEIENIEVEIIDIITKDKAKYKTKDINDKEVKITMNSYFIKMRSTIQNLDQLSIGKHKSLGYGVIRKVI